MLAQQAPPLRPPEVSAQEVYPGSCGDSKQILQTHRRVAGPQPRVQGSSTNRTPISELFFPFLF